MLQQQPQRMPIIIERFFTKYTPDPQDAAKTVGVDYVTYGSVGEFKSRTTDRISRLSSVLQDPENENPAVLMARLRWDAIRPSYEAWKAGREMPVNGTPLAAWNLLQPEEAEQFRMKGIRAVEDIAAMSGEQIRALGFPNGHDIVRQAQAFVQSLDASRGAAAIDKLTLENASLREQMEEQSRELAEIKQALLREEHEADQADGQTSRRGRPTNEERARRQQEQDAA